MPARKSHQSKRAHGTFRPDRESHPDADLRLSPVVPVPPPPGYLAASEQEAWTRLAPSLTGILTEADLESFAFLAVMVARAWSTARDPDATLNQVRLATQAAQSALASFGLTPSSREKVSALAMPDEDDPLAEFGPGSAA